MGPDRTEVTQQLTNALQAARTLRDEIRVNLHLASLDARDRWQALEPQLTAAEREMERGVLQISKELSKAVMDGLVRQLRSLRDTLPRAGPH